MAFICTANVGSLMSQIQDIVPKLGNFKECPNFVQKSGTYLGLGHFSGILGYFGHFVPFFVHFVPFFQAFWTIFRVFFLQNGY